MSRYLLALLFLAVLPIHAQEEDTPKNNRTCRIIFPERPNGSPKKVYLYDGKENRRFSLPSMNFSKVIGMPAGELTIMMSADKVDPENLPQGAPTLKIPENIRDFYILVTADRENKTLPLRMLLINANDGKFKPGKTLWFNLTTHRILAKLGETKMKVEPKGRTISESPVPKSGYYRADLFYQPEAEGKARVITEQMWWHDANSRHLGFIIPSGGRLPKIFYYRDFR